MSSDDEVDVAAARLLAAADEEEPGEPPPLLRWAGLTAAFGGVLFGYDLGIISSAMVPLADKFGLEARAQELVVSALLLGAVLGALVAGRVVDAIGRRGTIVANGAVFAAAGICLATAGSYEQLVVGRLVCGVAIALSGVADSLYLCELAPAALRGEFVARNEIGIALGLMAASFAGAGLVAVHDGWRWMFAIPSAAAVAQSWVMWAYMPPTPRWLLLKGRGEEARAVLRRLRAGDVEEELASIPGAQPAAPLPARALAVACALMSLQHTTGNTNVLYYGVTILSRAGFGSPQKAALGMAGVSVAKVVATVVASRRVDRWGRRTLLMWGAAAMAVALAALAGVIAAGGADAAEVLLLALFIVAYALSFGPIVWLLVGELFDDQARGRCVGIGNVFNWLSNLLVSGTFLSLEGAVGLEGCFGISAGMCVVSLCFVHRFVPETKGMSLEKAAKLFES